MKTASLFFLILSVICYLFAGVAKAQISGCGATTPYYLVDMTGSPHGTWTSPNHSRKGLCCAAGGSDRCTSFRVITDTAAVLLKLEIISGSIPAGSLYYQIGCGAMVPLGTGVWLTASSTYDITFCEPGNNANVYAITTYSRADTVVTGNFSAYTCGQTDLDVGVPGGTWSSSNTSIATVDASTGVVTSVSAGTTTISYVLNTVLIKTVTVTINPTPPITGTFTVCVGGTTSLSNAAPGGTWSSSTVASATIGSTGVVTGVSTGTSTITYSLGSGCTATAVVTVNQTVPAITGGPVCVSSTTTMANAAPGGTWSSGSTGVATIVAASGVASGVSSGTSNITYTITGGCRNTGVLTVNALPSAISGSSTGCTGAAATLTDAPSGGTWSSSNSGTATIGSSSGVLSPLAVGTTMITYTTAAGCRTTKTITINTSPVISGVVPVCEGSTVSLTASIGGGTWSRANGKVSINSSTGVMTGVSAGNVNVTYQLATGCMDVKVATVNPQPAAISGPSAVCQNSTAALTDATSGGTWSTSGGGVATLGSSGTFTGVSVGTITVSYTLTATGCSITKPMTVNGTPVISNAPVCLGATVSLSGSIAGGGWISSNTAVATVDTLSGVATGIALGTTSVTYQLVTGCKDIKTFTVNPQPDAITGPLSLCMSASTTLSDPTVGGTWSSKSASVATVDPASGIVSGVTAGQVYISYVLPTGCWARAQVTVNTTPIITNTAPVVCVPSTIAFTASVAGGTWSSGDPTIATIDGSGVATGVAFGNDIISYQLSNGCMDTAVLAVGALPAILGSSNLCMGTIQNYSNPISGGSWTCSDTTVGAIDATTGVFTCANTGVANITYATASGCSSTAPVTVNPVATLSGRNFMCIHLTTQLASNISGGTWSSSITDTATVNTTGLVTGIGGGTCLISYTTVNGCATAMQVRVNTRYFPLETQPLSTPMRTNICLLNTLGLNSPYGGDGKWTSSDTTVATVTNNVPGYPAPWGVVQSLALGTVTISYTASNGCTTTHTITINPMPHITVAPATMCLYSTTTLSGTPAGGQWISHNLPAAQIGSFTGILKSFKPWPSEIAYRLFTYDQCSDSVLINMVTCTPKSGSSADEGSNYSIYPNPGAGNFTISQVNVADQLIDVVVTNCVGQAVYTGKVSFVGGIGNLELPKATPGIYMVQLGGTLEERTVLKVAVQ